MLASQHPASILDIQFQAPPCTRARLSNSNGRRPSGSSRAAVRLAGPHQDTLCSGQQADSPPSPSLQAALA